MRVKVQLVKIYEPQEISHPLASAFLREMVSSVLQFYREFDDFLTHGIYLCVEHTLSILPLISLLLMICLQALSDTLTISAAGP